jgi:hypothetical protein
MEARRRWIRAADFLPAVEIASTRQERAARLAEKLNNFDDGRQHPCRCSAAGEAWSRWRPVATIRRCAQARACKPLGRWAESRSAQANALRSSPTVDGTLTLTLPGVRLGEQQDLVSLYPKLGDTSASVSRAGGHASSPQICGCRVNRLEAFTAHPAIQWRAGVPAIHLRYRGRRDA